MSEVIKQVIIVGTAIEGVKTMETSATTWGVLKAEINEQHRGILNPTGNNPMKVTVMDINGNNYPVENDVNTLPDGDFRIMLTPTKNKSGEGVEFPKAAYIKENKTKMVAILEQLIAFVEGIEAGDVTVEAVDDTPEVVEDPAITALKEQMANICTEDGINL